MGDKVGQEGPDCNPLNESLRAAAGRLESKGCVTPSCGEARPEGGVQLYRRDRWAWFRRREGKGASGTEQDHRHSRGEALGHSCS
jgi:hypothetical protein